MGSLTHLKPTTAFAHHVNQYFRHLVQERGWDASGRGVESRTHDGEPRRTVWAKFYAGTQAMNTNEIAIAARIFDMTPFEFVAGAREFAANVGGDDEDRDTLTPDQERAIRQEDLRLAALRGRNDADVTHAD